MYNHSHYSRGLTSRSDSFFAHQKPRPKDAAEFATILHQQQNLQSSFDPSGGAFRRVAPLPEIRKTEHVRIPLHQDKLNILLELKNVRQNENLSFAKNNLNKFNRHSETEDDDAAEDEDDDDEWSLSLSMECMAPAPPIPNSRKPILENSKMKTEVRLTQCPASKRPVQEMLLRSSSSFLQDYLQSCSPRPLTPGGKGLRKSVPLSSQSLDVFSNRIMEGANSQHVPYPPVKPREKNCKFRTFRENMHIKNKRTHRVPPMGTSEMVRPSAPDLQTRR